MPWVTACKKEAVDRAKWAIGEQDKEKEVRKQIEEGQKTLRQRNGRRGREDSVSRKEKD